MAHNAKKGGEIGANGEYYKGGQFVADSANTVKGKYLSRGPWKICIEPYKWIKADPDTFGIWQEIENMTFTYLNGKPLAEPMIDPSIANRDPGWAKWLNAMLDLYKNGERTINIVDMANLRKTCGAGEYWIHNKIKLSSFATV